jgi:nitrate reductase NapAB chaperone NapD
MKQKVKQWIQTRLRDLIMWAAGDYLDTKVDKVIHQLRLRADNAVSSMNRQNREHWEQIRDQVTALQAIDVEYHEERGKLILVASVGGKDIVKIIQIRRGHSILEWKQMVDEIEQRYGARPRFVDSPTPYMENLLWDDRPHLRRRKPGGGHCGGF